MKFSTFVLLGVLCSAAAPVWSQAKAPSVPDSKPIAARESGVSLAALLQLQPAQTERLNRMAAESTSRRLAQEAKIADFQIQLEQAPSLDARRVAQLQRDIDAARRKNVADFTATRSKARGFLPPVQRSQLDAFASDPRFRVRRDTLYQLLVAPYDHLSAPQDANGSVRRNWLEARQRAGIYDGVSNRHSGVGNYGVYGGYGNGGPQAGVYGGYHQGGVGVHAGIGLGGPSIGVSIGRVFGVGRR